MQFSLALPEDRAVVSELKKASTSRVPQPGLPHCVEISLKSSDSSGVSVQQVLCVHVLTSCQYRSRSALSTFDCALVCAHCIDTAQLVPEHCNSSLCACDANNV